MQAPIPSFFKIRILLCIVAVFCLFFFVGMLKQVFAVYPGDCAIVLVQNGANEPYHGDFAFLLSVFVVDGSDGSLSPSVYRYGADIDAWYLLLKSHYFEGDAWHSSGDSLQRWFDSITPNGAVLSLPEGCPVPCEVEQEILSNECGGPDSYFIDLQTCDGYCNPDNDCEDEFNALCEECGGCDQVADFRDNDCFGYCVDCASAMYAKTEECFGYENVINWDNETCTGDCKSPCEDERIEAAEQCGDGNFSVDNDTCDYYCGPGEDCESAWDEKCDECGSCYLIGNWDDENCTGDCELDCYEEQQIFEEYCDNGYTMDNDSCDGHCNPSEECAEEFQEKCDLCGDCSNVGNWDDEECTGDCAGCANEKFILEQECDGPVTDWDDVKCTGHCAPSEECTDEYLALESECADLGIDTWDNTNCTGTCNDLPDCEEHQDNCNDECGGAEYVESQNCDDDNSAAGRDCTCKDVDCEDYRSDCTEECGSVELVANYACSDNDTSGRVCECYPPDNDEPGTGDNDNSGLLPDCNFPTVEEFIGKFAIGTTKDYLIQLLDCEAGTNLSLFVDNMKTTALFSLPEKMLDIPTSGTSSITINGGSTFGTHNVDFVKWGDSFVVLRSLFMIVCAWAGIRIITLKS